MAKIIEVQVGDFRDVRSFHLNNIKCERDDYVIIEHNRSSEFGRVVSDTSSNICKDAKGSTSGKLLRVATIGDMRQIENNRMKAKEAMVTCLRKIDERQLEMRLAKCEYAFDNSKIIFFFTAEGRVDFRSLVKDLAKQFRVRIELKQIGVRDKAKIVEGYGVCGRELCCSSYMKDFHQLSIKMAKEQNLPLNPSKVSGVCNRIKCCMAYEYEVYREYSRKMPRMGQKVSTPQGEGRVTSVNILKRFVNIDIGEGKLIKVDYAENVTQ